MKKILLLFILVNTSIITFGQIIADHTVVDRYDDIPQYYIDLIKKMWIVVPGESHSGAYRAGLTLLESLNPTYAVQVKESGTPDAYSEQYLRMSNATWGDYSNSTGWMYSYGEEDWFTNATAISRTKAGITYCNTHNLSIAAIGFGWCWDGIINSTGGGIDPVYGVHWYGASVYGPQGDTRWGLDAGDFALTGNTVSMDTYLNATQDYINYCTTNGYPTKVFFTTGPVDAYYAGEAGYQGYLKHKHVRDYVKADPSRILFDYADILCYDDNGVQKTSTWNGHTYEIITTTNLTPSLAYHISEAGALRLGKALWWMLARMAGWDGVTSNTSVTSIIVNGAGGVTTIPTANGTLQLTATVSPSNATNQTVTWSVINGTGQATISAAGLVTALTSGTVTARATSNDGTGIYGSLLITISNQVIPVTNISVTGAGGATTIATVNGTLQLTAAVSPSNATNQTVTWSIINGTGQATISAAGLVTALTSGTVTARATSNDGTGIYGSLVITISNQVIPVTNISVTGAGGATTIATDNGTLQLTAAVSPSNATNKTVTWSVINGTGQATISQTGLVTALTSGTVTARATSNDGTGIYGSLVITISNQVIPVTNISVTGAGGATTIATDNGTLQLTAAVSPSNATNKTVTWSVINGTGQATISAAGLVTALTSGTVTARATSNDGTGIYGSLVITISNQVIPVTNISVTGAGGATTIATVNGTLQLTAAVSPSNATNQTVTWSIINGTGQATISAAGLVTALTSGTVTARATSNDGTGIYGSLVITISNQVIPVTNISVTGAGGATTIATDNGTLQLTAAVSPSNSTNQTVTWSIINGTGQATISAAGLVTALTSGTVTARATSNDGTGIYGSLVITISNQVIPVTNISVTGAGGATTIATVNGTLQLTAAVSPSNATNQTVTWSIINGTGQATISAAGLVTALTSGTVTARATSNDGTGINGELLITITSGSGGCINETFTAATGTVTDNSGASNYLNNMSCEKLIQPSGGGSITLSFTAFNTETGYDFVRVYNGSTTSAPLLGTFSGSSLPAAITASSGSMLIRFTTDYSVVAPGWSATYTSGVIPAYITITSPNGGEVWPVGSIHNITWTSSGTSGTVGIGYSSNNGTSWTSIISGTPDDGLHSWTIPNAPSTTCLVRVSDTDGSPVDISDAVFSIAPSASGGCINETFTAATGTVTDNSGASNYLNNMSCEKLIQPSGGGSITLSFTAFNTETGYDFVRVYNGSTTSAPLLGTFSGSSLPAAITASSGSMLIRFTTDYSVVAPGWSATYTSGVIPAYITITSPNGGEVWPVGSIHNITWTSSGTSGTVGIGYSSNNGTSWTSIISGTPDDGLHSWTIPNAPSTTCLVRVSDTDGSPVDISDAVFSIAPSASGGCINETFTAATGTVTDNSGASNYLNNMSCEKLIQPSGGGSITLSFTAFNIETGYDFVRVYNGSTTSAPLLGTFSGSSLPAAITASSGSMLIRFTTDYSVVAAGWSATYTASMPVVAIGTDQVNMRAIIPETRLVAYPNPTSGLLTIESSYSEEGSYTFELIDASGKIIRNQRQNVIGGKFDIDITEVSNGFYLLKISTDRTVRFIRVIKK